MCDETIGDNFHDAFNGENNQEDIFHFFLSSKMFRMIEAKKEESEGEGETSIGEGSAFHLADER